MCATRGVAGDGAVMAIFLRINNTELYYVGCLLLGIMCHAEHFSMIFREAEDDIMFEGVELDLEMQGVLEDLDGDIDTVYTQEEMVYLSDDDTIIEVIGEGTWATPIDLTAYEDIDDVNLEGGVLFPIDLSHDDTTDDEMDTEDEDDLYLD